MRKRLVAGIALIGLAAAAAAFAFRVQLREAIADRNKPVLPPAISYDQAATATAPSDAPAAPDPKPEPSPALVPEPKPAPAPKPSAEGKNLAVPFMSQAPHANWELPYQEACEEASLIMVHAYLSGIKAFTPDESDRQILAMVAWENGRFGYYEDTTAEETAEIAREYYGHEGARAVSIDSIADVKKEIDKGNAVILPAAGRMLGNPNFTGEGPLYHMLVAKGYTIDGQIITNDPGTRRGADFLYPEDRLWDAIHDWNGGDVANGRKVMVVVEP